MKPYLFCIDNGDGTPAMSEQCVAEDPDCLQEAADYQNEDNHPDAIKQKVVACYSEDQIADLRAQVEALTRERDAYRGGRSDQSHRADIAEQRMHEAFADRDSACEHNRKVLEKCQDERDDARAELERVKGERVRDERWEGTVLAQICKAYDSIGMTGSDDDPDSQDPAYIGDNVENFVTCIRAERDKAEARVAELEDKAKRGPMRARLNAMEQQRDAAAAVLREARGKLDGIGKFSKTAKRSIEQSGIIERIDALLGGKE